MAAHVDKRDKDGKSGSSGDPAAVKTGNRSPAGEPAAAAAGVPPGGTAEGADAVVQVAGTFDDQSGGSRLGDTLTAPFGRYGQLTVTTLSVVVLAVLVYLAVNGLIVTR